MIGKIIGDHLFSSGIGGPFYSLKCGLTGVGKDIPFAFIFPLFTPVALVICALCPPAYAVIISRALSPVPGTTRQRLDATVIAARGELLMALVFWWIVLIAGYQAVSYVISSEGEIYAKAARAGQNLQLATPEQMAYVAAVMRSYFIYAFALMMALFLSLTLSMAGLALKPSPLKLSLRAVFVNLPGYIALAMAMLIAFAFLEKEFSTLKMRHITGFMLGRKSFDPTWPFLILRIYLVGAFCAAAALCSALSLRLWRPFSEQAGKKGNGKRR
ncbi:MAG: hypothetical protein ACI4NA_07635 [Succinivibrio sp.]